MPEDIDEGLVAIRIAEVLNVSALEVGHLSPHWIRNARIKLAIDAMQHDRAVKKANEQRKRTARPATRRR